MSLRVSAEPIDEFPLNLIVPEPNCAVRLGRYTEEGYAHKLATGGVQLLWAKAVAHRDKPGEGSFDYPLLYTTIPDEIAANKIFNLERATRAANPKENEWSIYMTPSAALVPISGRQAAAENSDPISKSTLGNCLARISKLAGLRYEVFNDRIFIDLKTDEQNAQQSVPGYPPQGVGSPEP